MRIAKTFQIGLGIEQRKAIAAEGSWVQSIYTKKKHTARVPLLFAEAFFSTKLECSTIGEQDGK